MSNSTPPGEEPGLGVETPGASHPRIDDEIDWRARALEAESKLKEASAAVDELRASLEQSQKELARVRRAREIDRALADAGAVDGETAALVLESMLSAGSAADVPTLVDELRSRKPFLFAPGPAPIPSAMSPAIRATATEDLAGLAEEARVSGDRRTLLRYLRARRAL
jgi:hypothetical protein